ncbi:MAG: hypothetical protein HZB56_08100 [Deltaproteobacteria bacterium]|nr:hypothetical protein [Deltaproteobacteria bacterium]
MPSIRPGALLLALALAPPAAAQSEPQGNRLHPAFAARMAAVRTVGIVAPDIKLYELSASNDRVFQPEWSTAARGLVLASAEAAVKRRGLEPIRFEAPDGRQVELREVTLLEQAVATAILQATYFARFPAKVASFEYGLGDLNWLLGPQGPDALLFVQGHGHVSSGGRKAVQTLGAVLGGGMSRGIDRLFMALVDRTGELLWFDWSASSSYDLRDPESADAFVRALLDRIPGSP